MRIGHLIEVSNNLFLDANVKVMDDMLAEHTRLAISGFLWAENVGEVTIHRPANWWEHFKKWLHRPYRKLYDTISFRAYYPDYTLIPDLGRASLRVEVSPNWDIDEPLREQDG